MPTGIIIALIVFIIGFIIAIIFACIYSSKRNISHYIPKDKGEDGEKKIANILGDTIKGQQYVINGLCYSTKKGCSCEIDHILINKYGIWVIETKNLYGRIYGSSNDATWNQVTENETKPFSNPINQNYGHISTLKKDLNIDVIFHNVVVFLSRGDISQVSAKNVCTEFELPSFINTYRGFILSVYQMERCYKTLCYLKNNYSISKKKHNRNIKRRNSIIRKMKCPDCGGKLVIRNGKHGKYYGCSNYPDCQFRKNIYG